jgi:hypothetical protein
MSESRYRFESDSNRALFMGELDRMRFTFHDAILDVYVTDATEEVVAAANALGGIVIDDDRDYGTSSGLQDAGFHDTKAFSTRSNPPLNSRGQVDFRPSDQIVNPQRFPARRATRGQPL